MYIESASLAAQAAIGEAPRTKALREWQAIGNAIRHLHHPLLTEAAGFTPLCDTSSALELSVCENGVAGRGCASASSDNMWAVSQFRAACTFVWL